MQQLQHLANYTPQELILTGGVVFSLIMLAKVSAQQLSSSLHETEYVGMGLWLLCLSAIIFFLILTLSLL